MTLDGFAACLEHEVAHSEATLRVEGAVTPLFTIVDKRGHVRRVAADFTNEAAKEMSFAIVHTMCVAEAAIAMFHRAEAWAVLGDVAPGTGLLQSERRIEVLLVVGMARLSGMLVQRLSMREIERDPLGAISGLRDVPASALGDEDVQRLPLEGRIVDLLPAKAPTFVDRWRARGVMVQMAKRLTCGQFEITVYRGQDTAPVSGRGSRGKFGSIFRVFRLHDRGCP